MTRPDPPADAAADLDDTVLALERLRLPLIRLILARAERRSQGATLAERLSPAQQLTLEALREGPLSVGELAARTGVALSTATRMVQGLGRLGLVAGVEVEGADRRRRYAELTGVGRATMDENAQVVRGRIRDLLGPLAPAQRTAIVEGVRALTHALDEAER